MNDMQIFSYQDKPVRTVQKDGEPWFVLKDVCDVLGLAKPSNVATRLDDDEKGACLMGTPSGQQNMVVVNEPGLYKVILRSDKPEAKGLMRFVTHEILPALRKYGTYSLATVVPHRPPEVSPNGLARLISITRRIMLDAGDTPQDVKAVAKTILDAWCIPTTPEFSKQIPGQFTFFNHPALNG